LSEQITFSKKVISENSENKFAEKIAKTLIIFCEDLLSAILLQVKVKK